MLANPVQTTSIEAVYYIAIRSKIVHIEDYRVEIVDRNYKRISLIRVFHDRLNSEEIVACRIDNVSCFKRKRKEIIWSSISIFFNREIKEIRNLSPLDLAQLSPEFRIRNGCIVLPEEPHRVLLDQRLSEQDEQAMEIFYDIFGKRN